MTADYQEFIGRKSHEHIDAGFDVDDMPWPLKDFQRDSVAWACRRGRAALLLK